MEHLFTYKRNSLILKSATILYVIKCHKSSVWFTWLVCLVQEITYNMKLNCIVVLFVCSATC